MSFTYDFTTSPAIAYVRLLIPDTVNDAAQNLPIYQDEEIQAFYVIQASQFQSSMFFSGVTGRNLPITPLSYLRVAALAIDSIANNAARLNVIQKLLDVTVQANAAAILGARADSMRQVDDESGAMVIIEQVNTIWAYRDRYWNQIQRQSGGGGIP